MDNRTLALAVYHLINEWHRQRIMVHFEYQQPCFGCVFGMANKIFHTENSYKCGPRKNSSIHLSSVASPLLLAATRVTDTQNELLFAADAID